jgi:predicted permease
VTTGPVPRVARWLLAIAARRVDRASILIDLEDEASSRAERFGMTKTRRWSVRQAARSFFPLLAQRLAAAVVAPTFDMKRSLGLTSDLRLAGRRLCHAPGFAVVCIATLALGIGGNTAVFTLIDRVLLQPLPVSKPSELYRLGDTADCCVNSGFPGSFSLFSYDLFTHLREAAPEFSNLAAFQAGQGPATIGRADAGAPIETIASCLVSGNYFETFGLVPAAGRLFSGDDDRPGAPAVAVISYRAWTTRYNRRADTIGASVSLNGMPATIVGVAPDGFYGPILRPDPPDVWVPLSNEPQFQPQAHLLETKASHWLYAIGRARPGASMAAVSPRLTGVLQSWIAASLDVPTEYRSRIPQQHIVVVSAATGVRNNMRDYFALSLRLLQMIAATVLFIACANLANLLLARGLGRQRETAVRVALGAPRGRLVAESLVESVVLSLVGGLLGMGVAYAGARAIVLMTFPTTPNVPIDPSPSPLVLGFAVLLSLVTGAIFGAAPAFIGSRSDPIDAMRGAGRTAGDGGSRLRRSLVVVQVALSLVLITCAGLLGRSLARLQYQDFGFLTTGRYVVSITPSLGNTSTAQLHQLYPRIRERLARIPGVADVAFSLYGPMSGDNWSSSLVVEGHATTEQLAAAWTRVSPGFFETVGIPLLRGRAISDADGPGGPPVAVVTQNFARKFFGDADPIGRRFAFPAPRGSTIAYFQIVGVVADVKYRDAEAAPYEMFFLPFLQSTTTDLDRSQYPKAIEIHTVTPVPDLEHQVRAALAEIDRRIAVREVATMEDQVASNFNLERLIARLTITFGLVALLLACLGLYGITAYAVVRRTREIGVRMAIGATRGAVMGAVLRSACSQVLTGLMFGVPAAIWAGALLESRLYGVSSYDPLVLTAGIGALVMSGALAALIPARRAATIDPVRALRTE